MELNQDSEIYNTVACLDCVDAGVNADYSQMTADREAEVRSAYAFLANDGYRAIIDTYEEAVFSGTPCAVCNSSLKGYRYATELIPL